MCDKVPMSICLLILRRLAPFLCLFLWVPPLFSMGEVYQWTDSRGVIHFTDNYRAVPESIKGSPRLIVREDLLIGGEVSEVPPLFENVRREPALEPEVKRPPEPVPVKVVPQIVVNSPQFTTIVVVNSLVTRPKKKRRLPPDSRRPVFRPNIKDRRFIHPSVFSGGSRQFIHPSSFR